MMCEIANYSAAGDVGGAASLVDAGSHTTSSHGRLVASCDADRSASAGTTVVLGDAAAQNVGSPELGAGVASDECVADAACNGAPATTGLGTSTAARAGEDGSIPPAAGSAGPEPTGLHAVRMLHQQARRLMQSRESTDGAIHLLCKAEASLEALGRVPDRNELRGAFLEDLGSCYLANKDFERAEAASRRCS